MRSGIIFKIDFIQTCELLKAVYKSTRELS